MLEDTWALGPFVWACIPSWHNKGSFLAESNSQHWYSADNSGIGWRKGPRIHGRTLDFTSFGMFFWTFVYIFSPRFVFVVICRCLRALPKVRTGQPEWSFWKWNISILSEFVLKLTTTVHTIEHFHSRGQHLCWFTGTKENVFIRKEFNPRRISLVHYWTWPPFPCLGTPEWPQWRHVKTLYLRINWPGLIVLVNRHL